MTETRPSSLHGRSTQLRLAIEIIADKWRIPLLYLLASGPQRTSQLQKALDEVAPKVLTQTLRGLERDGLVRRKAHAIVPPRVDYELTEMARLLLGALDGLHQWSETYGRQIPAARRDYDAQTDVCKVPCALPSVARGRPSPF